MWLENGNSSFFRFNADGYPSGQSKSLENITVGANDSIFVFIEITPKANMQNVPIHIADNLLFSSNGQTQKIALEAYGQDAVILKNYSLTTDETFVADKPYLIFGFLHIPKDKTLTIKAGTKIFLHRGNKMVLNTGLRNVALDNTGIVVEGNLVAQGSTDSRISIRGDRFDLAYTNIPYSFLPSQWGGIYFFSETGENSLINTDIIGGGAGIVLYGNANIAVRLKVENSIIHCIGEHGFMSQFGDLAIINSEISNCGKSAVLQRGGRLKMAHTTIANYMPSAFVEESRRNHPAVSIVSFATNGTAISAFPIEACVIENCIISGSRQNEILLKDTTLGIPFNVFISNCLIKSKEIVRPQLQEIIWAETNDDDIFMQNRPNFNNLKESGYFDFRLSEQSIAKDKANPAVSRLYPLDLLGKNRFDDNKPDIGAYEK